MSTSNNNDPDNLFGNNNENDFPGFDFQNSESETDNFDPLAAFDSAVGGGNVSSEDNKKAANNGNANFGPTTGTMDFPAESNPESGSSVPNFNEETGELSSPDGPFQVPEGDSNIPQEKAVDSTATKGKKGKKDKKHKSKQEKAPKEKKEKLPWNFNATMSLLLGLLLFAGVAIVNVLVLMQKWIVVVDNPPTPFLVAFNICAVIMLLVPFMFYRKCRFENQVCFYDTMLGCALILVSMSCMIMICVQFTKYGTDIKAKNAKLTTAPVAAPAPAEPAPATPAPTAPAPATPDPAAPAPGTPAPATPAPATPAPAAPAPGTPAPATPAPATPAPATPAPATPAPATPAPTN